MNPEQTEYLLRLHHAVLLEMSGVLGTRYNTASKLIRDVTGLTSKKKKKLLADFENILKDHGILK